MRMDSGNTNDARRGYWLTKRLDSFTLHVQHRFVPPLQWEERE